MTTWASLREAVITLTNKPTLIAETDLAIKNALRTAHKSGKYWRDLVKTTSSPTVQAVQEIDLSIDCPRFRQLAYLKSKELDKYYPVKDIQDLLDEDNYARMNICWGLGTKLFVRSDSPELQYEVAYYQYPVITVGSDVTSWILDQYDDLVHMWAAAQVLNIVGEQEMKTNLEKLSAIAFADLQQDNLELDGR